MNTYQIEITRSDDTIDHTTVYADTLRDAVSIAYGNIVECDAITAVKMTARA